MKKDFLYIVVVGLILALPDRLVRASDQMLVLSNAVLRISLNPVDATFRVRDQRTGHEWVQQRLSRDIKVERASSSPSGIEMELATPYGLKIRAVVELDTVKPEFTIGLQGTGELKHPLQFPHPFATTSGERLVIPMNEGISYSVEDADIKPRRMAAYALHGMSMAFWGVTDGKAGHMAIFETPDDAAIRMDRLDGRLGVMPEWDSQHRQFGYERRIRYIFFDQGGHVAMCKRYRTYAKQIGRWTPFTEKVKRNPNIDRLIGAANVWSFSADTNAIARSSVANPSTGVVMRAGTFTANVRLVAEMQAAGMDRILWSGSASPWTATGARPEDLAAMNALPNVLAGRYDNYQDILDPKKFDEVCYHNANWVTDAFPRDVNWAGPTNQLREGWGIPRKAGAGYVNCVVICDACALPYARKRIAEELKVLPYRARFIDTTVAAPWFECFNPDHPMTRSQSRQHKMELLNLVSDEFGLVCGSETGHDAAVPFCDYFEGMMSLVAYRISEAGRNQNWVLKEVPERVSKYQVGEAYRLPLWELVYHDCVVAYWYWGDYNNKMPAIWHKRDLFNALYGTPPMYLFCAEQWAELKDRLVASYKVAQPVARATGYAEMTDHRILTPDCRVQQTVFANGVTVTVNFGDTVFRLPSGVEIGGGSFLVARCL